MSAQISDFDVLAITTAYEQGFGHAFRTEISNPYKPGIPAERAWDMGRAAGRRQGEPADLAPSIHKDNARVLQGNLNDIYDKAAQAFGVDVRTIAECAYQKLPEVMPEGGAQ